MYNEEIKNKFIEGFSTSASRNRVARLTFLALEPHEVTKDADICTFSEEELQKIIPEIVGMRVASMNTRMSVLKSYSKWCIKNGIPGACDALQTVKVVGIEKVRRQMVANPKHLQMFLDYIFDAEDEETVDCTYRCFYWMAFAQIPEEEALEIKISEVNFDLLEINHNGKAYPICRESVKAFKKCVDLTEFRYKHPNYEPVIKNRAYGDKVLRGFSETRSLTAMRVEMSRRAQRVAVESSGMNPLDLNLSYFRVSLSGMYYKFFEEEMFGIEPDFKDAAKQFMEGKEYNLSHSRNTIGAKQRKLASDYREDYLRWKEAFSK